MSVQINAGHEITGDMLNDCKGILVRPVDSIIFAYHKFSKGGISGFSKTGWLTFEKETQFNVFPKNLRLKSWKAG
jgi:hypothetical protein